MHLAIASSDKAAVRSLRTGGAAERLLSGARHSKVARAPRTQRGAETNARSIGSRMHLKPRVARLDIGLDLMRPGPHR